MSKESTNIEDIPVILSFEIGEQSISVSGLNQLQEQYIFEFDNQIDQQVKIKVNGRSLGVGELVKVNEHIGVRLLKFNHQTDYSYYEETSKYNKLDINYDEEIDYEDSNNFEDNEDNEDELIDKQMNHGHMD